MASPMASDVGALCPVHTLLHESMNAVTAFGFVPVGAMLLR